MKIGLLTYYGDLNFGTNLQAYATYKALKNSYPNDDVEVIPVHTFWLRIIPYKSLNPFSIYRDIVRIKKYRDFKINNLQIKGDDPNIPNPVEALEYIKSRHYDVIYIGADTLLELDRLPEGYNGLSCYWLKDIPAKKIVIAASAKNTQFDKLTTQQQADLIVAASQFSSVAVRDRATFSLFSKCIDSEKIEMIPDPTFSYEIDYSYVEKYIKQKKIQIPSKSLYINSASSDVWLTDVVSILKKEGYYIVTPRPTPWTDLSLNDMGPLEQAGIFKYVSFVITHRFHEGVFCLKNHTPFILYAPNGMMTSDGESKHVSLLKDFNLYPLAFIGSQDTKLELTDINQRINNVIASFDFTSIDKIMKLNAEKYTSYIKRTVTIVKGDL